MLTYHHAKNQDIFLDCKKILLRNNNILYHMLDIPKTDIKTLSIQVIDQFASHNLEGI